MFRRSLLALALVATATGAVGGASATPPVPTKGTINPHAVLGLSQTITSPGPLTNITLADDLSCQVKVLGSSLGQVFYSSYNPGDCGTFVAVGGALYAPGFASHAGTATGALGAYTPFTKVSSTPVAGAGTVASPYIVTTVADAGTSGIRVTQIDTYVTGRTYYRSDIIVSNYAATTQTVDLSRGVDCYLAGSDSGNGMKSGVTRTTVGCVKPATGRMQRLIPQSDANSYIEGYYSSVWSAIGAKAPLPNTCVCPPSGAHDNGIAVSWRFTLPPNTSAIRSVHHDFVDTGIILPYDPRLPECAVDLGSLETVRPRVSCTGVVTPPTGTGGVACAADAVVNPGLAPATAAAAPGADAAVACATPVGNAACWVSLRSAATAQPVNCALAPVSRARRGSAAVTGTRR